MGGGGQSCKTASRWGWRGLFKYTVYNSGLISAEPLEKGGRWAAGSKEETFFIWALSTESIQATLLLWNVFLWHNEGHVEAFFVFAPPARDTTAATPSSFHQYVVVIRLTDVCLLCFFM